ncbi:hypothetical protein BC827DRAFT_546546 [Russula dissimulans]|nr:hypothetical protein BC827DRAFT_546546 [Russula dissimulans]
MVTFNDTVVIPEGYFSTGAVVKLWHAIDGLYIWEFLTTLDYEWSVIRGNRPYRWTIWVYSCTRVATLVSLIENIIVFNVSSQINCQLWLTFELIFSHIGVATASFLIVLRVIAVWNKNKIVNAIALSAWVANVSGLIYGIVPLRSEWSPTTNTCLRPNTMDSNLNWIVSLCTDTVLFLTMLLGLLRWSHCKINGNGSSLVQLLWNQGLIWLFLATFAYVLPVVFLSLNLNASFNLIFQTPTLVTLSIAATRMYRSLTDFTVITILSPTLLEGVISLFQRPIGPVFLQSDSTGWRWLCILNASSIRYHRRVVTTLSSPQTGSSKTSH